MTRENGVFAHACIKKNGGLICFSSEVAFSASEVFSYRCGWQSVRLSYAWNRLYLALNKIHGVVVVV